MKINTTEEKLEKVNTAALCLALFQGEKPVGEVEELDKRFAGAITEAIRLGDFKGKLYEVVSLYAHGKVRPVRILLVGGGKKGEFDARIARNLAGAAARQASKIGARKIAFYLRPELGAEEVIEGVGLAGYNTGIYKTKREDERPLELLTLVGKVGGQAMKKANVVVEATNWVRKLIGEPANVMTPAQLVEEAKSLAKTHKFDIEVINEEDAARRGFGAFVGVARGSEEPSFLVALKYKGGGRESLAVIGKGITFDSGGISLKPADKMHEMKMDMAGAAAVLGAMKVIGQLRPKLNVIALLPLTENLPGGKALKPGDILKSLSGKTIEVLNTDAEGRVVLADALTYAQKLGATKLVDLATLTGAVLVALGSEAAAILGNKESWVKEVTTAAQAVGERLWQIPIYPEHKELLKSEIADVANVPPSKGAGVIAGAVFLQEFVDPKVDWAHLDIAGTAWLDGEKPYLAKGPTGFGVRTLARLVESMSD